MNLIYHGKTGYDFGFAEYFFATAGSMQRAKRIVPRIYSLYYNTPTRADACRSVGCGNWETIRPDDQEALVFEAESG